MHHRNAHGPRTKQCPLCLRWFVTESSLKHHAISCQNAKPYQNYMCKICGTKFTLKGNLTKHLQSPEKCHRAKMRMEKSFGMKQIQHSEHDSTVSSQKVSKLAHILPKVDLPDEIYLPVVTVDNIPQHQHVLLQDRHLLTQHQELLPQSQMVLRQGQHVLPQDQHVLPQDQHVLPQDPHVLPQDQPVQPQDHHVLPQGQDVLPQNQHVLPQEEHVLSQVLDTSVTTLVSNSSSTIPVQPQIVHLQDLAHDSRDAQLHVPVNINTTTVKGELEFS